MIADDEGQQTVVNLVREQYSIGRTEGHAIRLTERNISRKHARIQRTPSGFRIEDLASYNGLFLNGVRVVGRQELAHGDLIQLGDYRVQVIDEAIDTQEQGYRLINGEAQAAPASGRLPHRLVELIGPNQGAEFPLEGERFLIGRGSECEFTVDHGSVSRVHAEVRSLGDEKFEIIDKGSANGLRINGHPLARAILDSRDVVELGDVVFKYIPKGQVFRANEKEGTRIAALAGGPQPPAPTKTARSGPGPILIAAGIGAAVLGAIALYVPKKEQRQAAPETSVELREAREMIERGDLLEAGEELLSRSESERALPEFATLEKKWATLALAQEPRSEDDDRHRKLLDLISKTESLPDHLREQALKKLTEVSEEGAIDLSSLEDGKSPEADENP